MAACRQRLLPCVVPLPALQALKDLTAASVSLFRGLFERQSRKPFSPEGTWRWDMLPLKEIALNFIGQWARSLVDPRSLFPVH